MSREFKGNINQNNEDDFEQVFGKEMDAFLDELENEQDIGKIKEIAASMSPEDQERFIEAYQKAYTESELEQFGEIAKAFGLSAEQKEFFSKIVEENAQRHLDFTGTKRNDDKYHAYIQIESALELIIKELKLSEDDYGFNPPNQGERNASAYIDLPDEFVIPRKCRTLFATAIRYSDRTSFGQVRELGREDVDLHQVRFHFTVYDVWE